jgi:hypothetical protein
MCPTAALRDFLCAVFDVDAVRGEQCEVALGEDDVAHVLVTKIAESAVSAIDVVVVIGEGEADG